MQHWLSKLLEVRERFSWSAVMCWALACGLFIQISGKVWLVSGGARNTQIYLWLLLPVLIFFIYRLVSRNFPYLQQQYLPWILFIFWVSFSTVWADQTEISAFSLVKRGIFIVLYLFAINILIRRNEILFRRVLLAAVLVVALGALLSLIYQYGVLEKPLGYRAYRIDRMGFGEFADYGWPVAAGIFNGSIAMWAIGIALDRRSNHRDTILWCCVFAILAIYVLLTGTRGALFALLFGCIASALMQNFRLGLRLLTFIAVLFVIFSVIFWDQIAFELQRRQLSGRGAIWIYYIEVMRDHWWFGHGLGTPFVYVWPGGKMISAHAHSLYLQQIYDSGLLSLILLIASLSMVFLKIWKLRYLPWVRLATPALMFALIAMLTDVERIFTRPSDYWTVFWLPVAILLAVPKCANAAKEDSQSPPLER